MVIIGKKRILRGRIEVSKSSLLINLEDDSSTIYCDVQISQRFIVPFIEGWICQLKLNTPALQNNIFDGQ